jgi:endonuclease/exonuclease/phosphatase (EEP) superfamily protein YafD
VDLVHLYWIQNLTFFVQVHTLLKGLEKIAASADIPMLVAGDFNSVPTRSVYMYDYLDPILEVFD